MFRTKQFLCYLLINLFLLVVFILLCVFVQDNLIKGIISVLIFIIFFIVSIVFHYFLQNEKEEEQENLKNIFISRTKRAKKFNSILQKRIIKRSDEIAYIVDIRNDKVVYYNKKANDLFKFAENNLTTYNDLAKNLSPELETSNIRKQKTIEINKIVYQIKIINCHVEEYNDGLMVFLKNITIKSEIENKHKSFIVDVSHEFKTPLAIIQGYAETLIKYDDKAIRDKFLNIIVKETQRLNRLITSLTRLSKLESKEEIINEGIVDVKERVMLTKNRLEVLAMQKRQEIHVSYHEETAKYITTGEDDSILQVFINILDNAIKNTDEGGQINVKLSYDEENIKVEFEDNGRGISSTDIDKIFDRFFRVDKHRNKADGGSGLGLSISKEIIERHDGKIICESELGVGTKMIIYLRKTNI